TMPAVLKSSAPLNPPHFIEAANVRFLYAALISAAVAGAVAALVGVPLMRLSGLSAGIGTFAFLLITQDLLRNSTSLTAGEESLVGVPLTTTMWSAFAWACAILVVAFAYQQSRFGLRLRASRESEAAAAASGIRIRRERWLAFVLSACMVG